MHEVLKDLIEVVLVTVAQGGSTNAVVEVLKVAIAALGPIIAALIVGIAGVLITSHYASKREQTERSALNDRHAKDLVAIERRHDLDKESEWRAHAVELTKLEFQRKLDAWKENPVKPKPPLRPIILDFLAIYRDLQELDKASPKELYKKISESRITRRPSASAPVASGSENPEILKNVKELQPIAAAVPVEDSASKNVDKDVEDATNVCNEPLQLNG
jgi:hypothetical protein